MDKQTGISLCMIVKDEAKRIKRAIESVSPVVDEIIVVDTGSSDTTVEIADSCGARVFSYEWHDDFAAARNFALKQSTREWILVIDADECLSKKDLASIKEAAADPDASAYVLQQRNYCNKADAEGWRACSGHYIEEKGFAGFFDVPVIRLFRNDERIFFEGVVHEVVDDSLAGLKKRYLDIPIHHFSGFDDEEVRARKTAFYLSLLHKELEDDPSNIKTLFLLGRQYYSLNDYARAIFYLKDVVQAGSKCEMAYDNLASALIQTGLFEEARDVLEHLLTINPRYAEAYSGLGVAYSEMGYMSKSIDVLKRGVELAPRSFRVNFNLAATYYRQGNYQKALEAVINAESLLPGQPRCAYLKFFCLVKIGDSLEALNCSEDLRSVDNQLYEKIRPEVEKLRALFVSPDGVSL